MVVFAARPSAGALVAPRVSFCPLAFAVGSRWWLLVPRLVGLLVVFLRVSSAVVGGFRGGFRCATVFSWFVVSRSFFAVLLRFLGPCCGCRLVVLGRDVPIVV